MVAADVRRRRLGRFSQETRLLTSAATAIGQAGLGAQPNGQNVILLPCFRNSQWLSLIQRQRLVVKQATLMNEHRTEQEASLPPSRTAPCRVEAKSREANQGRHYLVEFLLGLKQMQIAAQKASASLKPS